MKFKDLKVGQQFRMENWQPGAVNKKIKPTKTKSGLIVTHQCTETGISACWVKDSDEVIPM